ncbi:hypothetical protein KO465_09310 [Candidatus Micrarchaeota archaeon]|jgi:hypothetical protein|nr:hypothetical protein [Candidatus Micrarchaeota archaeon]
MKKKIEPQEQSALKDYTQIVVETDEENPIVIATITACDINVKNDYRVRLRPKYD